MSVKGNKNASKFDMALVEEICLKVTDGENIKTVLKSDKKFPDFTTWCRWKRENESVYNLYINAIQDKAEGLENEMDDLRDMLINKEIDPSTYNTIVQTLKWKAAKFYPKMFGDQSKITLEGGINVTNKQDYSEYSTEDLEVIANISKKYEKKKD